jgi:hypothetical protein
MYRIFVAIPLFLLLITVPARAQAHAQQGPSDSELPNKPEIQTGIHAESHAGILASNSHSKIADKKFWILAGLQVGATFADFETTQWAQRVRPDGGELNPLYGRHPGRVRMYGIGMSLTGAQILLQYRSKAKGQESGKLKKAWIVGALLNTGVHTFLAVHNGEIAGQGRCGPGEVCP